MARPTVNRRDFLSASVAVGSTLAAGDAAAQSIAGGMPWTEGQANAPSPTVSDNLQYLTADEAAFLDAAVARLIPADELGPGAKEAGVTRFIDGQLAGAFGRAQAWYMQGPWHEGTPSQGYQSRLTPAQFYRTAVAAIDEHCRRSYQGKTFRELGATEQDQVLTAVEKGDVKLTDADAKAFFALLLQNTLEGFWSDPIYGGNRDMMGWKLIGFPGAHYDYRPYVAKHGERLDLQPVGLKGRPEWSSKT